MKKNEWRLAFTHPGKMGDALYTLPAMRYITNYFNTTADFYTSSYCAPMKRLYEYQSFIDGFFMPDNYKIERMDMGVQPWYIPVDKSLYQTVFQLGFRQVPDAPLYRFIAATAGIGHNQELEIKYECPDIETLDEPYIVIGPRGKTTFEPLYLDIIEESPFRVVQIGGHGDAVGDLKNDKIVDKTGLDFLDTCSWLKNARGYVGLMSAMLVLANGFDIPRISPHDGKSWDMRHVVRSEYNYYPVNPTAVECLNLMGIIVR
jgi:hypothetical protein